MGVGECIFVGEEGYDYWGDDKYGIILNVSVGCGG